VADTWACGGIINILPLFSDLFSTQIIIQKVIQPVGIHILPSLFYSNYYSRQNYSKNDSKIFIHSIIYDRIKI
jgi:hypothetical protein